MTEFALIRYDAACRAVAEAKTVDEVKGVRDAAIAMKAYARQARNKTMEADAAEIRMRAERRVGQMMTAQKKTAGLAKGGGGKHGRKRVSEKPTLEQAGIDKNLAERSRKLAKLDDEAFEKTVVEGREAVTNAADRVVNKVKPVVEHRARPANTDAGNIALEAWKKLPVTERRELLSVPPEKVGSFNRQENTAIEWAQFSWNPVTGCQHDCPYCYARDITTNPRTASAFPNGFVPTIRPASLFKPRIMKVPEEAATDERFRNVFTCSMADLFGRWVPVEWIEAVLREIRAAPNWNFLCLTKFPKRMAEFDIPVNAWMGTTIDLQARVANAEAAFAKVQSKVRWLSVEPMLEPIRFTHLDRFNWIVIGGSSKSTKTPEFIPPVEWVFDLWMQAREAGIPVYMKSNLGVDNRILQMPFASPIGDLFAGLQEAPAELQYLKRARGEAAEAA